MSIINTLCFVLLCFALHNNFILELDCCPSVEVSVYCVNINNWYLEKQTSHPELAIYYANLGLDLLNFTASGLGLGNYLEKRMPRKYHSKSPVCSLGALLPSKCWTVQLTSVGIADNVWDPPGAKGRKGESAESRWGSSNLVSPQLSLQGQGILLLSLTGEWP